MNSLPEILVKVTLFTIMLSLGVSVDNKNLLGWIKQPGFLIVPAQSYVAEFLATFKAYPPRQKAASFSLELVMERLEKAVGGPA